MQSILLSNGESLFFLHVWMFLPLVDCRDSLSSLLVLPACICVLNKFITSSSVLTRKAGWDSGLVGTVFTLGWDLLWWIWRFKRSGRGLRIWTQLGGEICLRGIELRQRKVGFLVLWKTGETMRTKAIRLFRVRGALGTSASASSSPPVCRGASSALLAKPTSTEDLNRPQVLGSAGFGELRRPVVGFANLGTTSCPASVRLLWAGRSGASCEKVEVSYKYFLSLSRRAEGLWFYEYLDKLRPLNSRKRLRARKRSLLSMLSLKSTRHFEAPQLEELQLFTWAS